MPIDFSRLVESSLVRKQNARKETGIRTNPLEYVSKESRRSGLPSGLNFWVISTLYANKCSRLWGTLCMARGTCSSRDARRMDILGHLCNSVQISSLWKPTDAYLHTI
jgi:hypothetical protein